MPLSVDITSRKKNKKPVLTTTVERDDLKYAHAVVEYVHKMLPTDDSSLTSEDTTVDDIDANFELARNVFRETLQQRDLEVEKIKLTSTLEKIQSARRLLDFSETAEEMFPSPPSHRKQSKPVKRVSGMKIIVI